MLNPEDEECLHPYKAVLDSTVHRNQTLDSTFDAQLDELFNELLQLTWREALEVPTRRDESLRFQTRKEFLKKDL